jgi:hypothetical protein
MSHRSHRPFRPLAARIGVFGTLAAAAGFVACSSPGTQGPQVSTSTNPASVTIDVRDAGDHHVGSCSGTLLSAGVVVTAGHCVIASGGAIVTTGDGQTAFGLQFWSTWENFQSSWSHPLHSDVAVILLDRPLFVSAYPSLASSLAEDGQTLSRIRRVDATSVQPGNFEQVSEPVHLGAARGFPLAYTMDAAGFEGGTDTGGALIDPATNTLYGVVSSRGLTSGEIYVSRIEYLAGWVGAIAQCTPPPITAQCHPTPPTCDGGGSSSGSSGGMSSSGSSSGGESSSGSSSGGGESSSGGGSSSGGSGGSSSGSGGWSSSGAGSSGSGSGGSGSGSGGGSSGGGGGGCNPPPPPPPPPMGGGDDGGGDDGGDMGDGGCNHGGSSGGSGGNGSSSGTSSGSSSGIFGGSSGGTASSSGSSSGSGQRTPLPGPGGYPLIPDGPGCYDDTCGGCANDPSCDDGQQDYGDCGCEPGAPYEAGPTQ